MNNIKKDTVRKLRNLPDSDALWRGLGDNFDNLTQIINEFIDNSFSNFSKNKDNDINKIIISIRQLDNQKYEICIQDNGSGIRNLNAAFKIGDKSAQESPLNEHGFGMKHALAAANKANDDWEILTRTVENKNKNEYEKISAPYLLDGQKVETIESSSLPEGLTDTGTVVKFKVSRELLKTITRGLSGNYVKLKSIMNILAEDIGYTYGPLLDAKLADIIIKYRDTRMDSFEKINVLKVEPLYEQTIEPGIGNTDISMSNGKSININYRFLSVKKANYKKHYLKNMSTSGVEIRLNGRLLADNLFSEIWSVEQHNEYNYLLVQIDVQSDDAGCLPETTTNKTSLMQDDPILEKIYGWIKAKLPNPKTRAALSDHETELFDELKEKKKKLYKDIDSSSVVKTEQYAFSTLNEKIRIDLYQSVNNKVTIYEGKKGKTTPKDVYCQWRCKNVGLWRLENVGFRRSIGTLQTV